MGGGRPPPAIGPVPLASVRLGTLLTDGGPRAVALVDGRLAELPGSVRSLLAAGTDAAQRALEAATTFHDLDPARLGPAVADPGKVICIGKNYADHAEELGGRPPEKPEVFLRARTSLAGPYQPVMRPRVSEQMDWEVELAVVIGRGGRHIRAADAPGHVAGYAVFNDISIRDYQNFGRQWTPGKNFDGSGPLGPFLVTADEVPDPARLELTCDLISGSGEVRRMQSSNTRLMVHPVPAIIAFLSEWTTIEPGDVIATGTPGGVGFGRSPVVWMQPGETVVCRVEGVGELKNEVVEEPSDRS